MTVKKKAKPQKKAAKPAQSAADRIRAKVGLAVRENTEKLSKPFIEAAKKLNDEIDSAIANVDKTLVSLVSMIAEFKHQNYSRVFGLTFDEWKDQKSENFSLGKSQIGRFLKIHRELVEGPDRISKSEVNKMSQYRAEMVARLPAASRTPEVIKAAQTLTDKHFQDEVFVPIQQKLGRVRTAPKGEKVKPSAPKVYQIGPYFVSKDTQEDWHRALDIGIWKSQDGDTSKTLPDKGIASIAAEIIATHGADYDEYLRQKEEQEEEGARQHAKKAS